MSYLNGMNDWGDDTEESLGDILEEKLEDDAKDAAKDGAKKGGKSAAKGLDKLTDKITPVKNIKDKVKEKLSNNPITRLKHSIQKAKKKIKDGAKKLAKDGIKAIGRAIAHAMKGIMSWIIANPIPALIIFIVLIIIFNCVDTESEDEQSDSANTDTYIADNSALGKSDGMNDDDVVVVLMNDCGQMEESTASEGSKADSDKTQSAKYIYSIFRNFGFSNASIAGILANLDCESGLDPTCIEGIYDEPAFLGPRKTAAIKSMSKYTVNDLFPKYAASGLSINKDGYKAGKDYYCGMGLVQWTGPGAKTFLSAAKTVDMDWYTMEFQLAYMLSDTLYRRNFFTQWVVAQESGDDEAAAVASAIKFAHAYEGNHSFDEQRTNAGKEWFGIIKDWGDNETDTGFVDSITALATQLGGLIKFDEVAEKNERCGSDAGKFDNSSLAAAAVSYAWSTKDKSYNDGTNLYKAVIYGVLSRDTYYKACDRAVAGAVRWSGTDDEYPLVTSTQLEYLRSSPKWTLVGTADKLTEADLQPGDVFILDGHTLMYVGEEAIKNAHGDKAEAGSNSMSASLDERSASCNADVTHIFGNGGGDERGVYHVFRCSTPDNSTTYSNVGAGVKN